MAEKIMCDAPKCAKIATLRVQPHDPNRPVVDVCVAGHVEKALAAKERG